jgi:hypothetical protein
VHKEDLSVEGIIMTHDRIMADKGGDCRILSEANLLPLFFRANLIPDLAPRAAFIFYSLCVFPAFREENTGTALAVTEQVLASGGYQITGGEVPDTTTCRRNISIHDRTQRCRTVAK